jgi:hypothetical protein
MKLQYPSAIRVGVQCKPPLIQKGGVAEIDLCTSVL